MRGLSIHLDARLPGGGSPRLDIESSDQKVRRSGSLWDIYVRQERLSRPTEPLRVWLARNSAPIRELDYRKFGDSLCVFNHHPKTVNLWKSRLRLLKSTSWNWRKEPADPGIKERERAKAPSVGTPKGKLEGIRDGQHGRKSSQKCSNELLYGDVLNIRLLQRLSRFFQHSRSTTTA